MFWIGELLTYFSVLIALHQLWPNYFKVKWNLSHITVKSLFSLSLIWLFLYSFSPVVYLVKDILPVYFNVLENRLVLYSGIFLLHIISAVIVLSWGNARSDNTMSVGHIINKLLDTKNYSELEWFIEVNFNKILQIIYQDDISKLLKKYSNSESHYGILQKIQNMSDDELKYISEWESKLEENLYDHIMWFWYKLKQMYRELDYSFIRFIHRKHIEWIEYLDRVIHRIYQTQHIIELSKINDVLVLNMICQLIKVEYTNEYWVPMRFHEAGKLLLDTLPFMLKDRNSYISIKLDEWEILEDEYFEVIIRNWHELNLEQVLDTTLHRIINDKENHEELNAPFYNDKKYDSNFALLYHLSKIIKLFTFIPSEKVFVSNIFRYLLKDCIKITSRDNVNDDYEYSTWTLYIIYELFEALEQINIATEYKFVYHYFSVLWELLDNDSVKDFFKMDIVKSVFRSPIDSSNVDKIIDWDWRRGGSYDWLVQFLQYKPHLKRYFYLNTHDKITYEQWDYMKKVFDVL